MDEKEQGGETPESALLPKSLFGESAPEPGTKCEIKVVRVYEDEVEVEYVRKDKDSKESKPSPSPEEQLDAMAVPGQM